MTVCRLSIKIHFFVNSIKFPLPRRGARLGCDDKVKNAENLPVMFLIPRKVSNTQTTLRREMIMSDWRCDVVRVSRQPENPGQKMQNNRRGLGRDKKSQTRSN